MWRRWWERLRQSKREHKSRSDFLGDLREIPASREPLNRELKTAWLDCLLIQVYDDNSADISRNVERVVSICLQNQGVVLDLMASIQLVAFGIFAFQSGSKEEIRGYSSTTLDELIAALGKDVRIVRFSGDTSYGNVGGAERFAFTIAPNNFDRFLAALLSTDFGCVTELPATT
jgi:hypothetical protein